MYITPKKDRRLIALFSAGVWIEVYRGEVILVHKKRLFELIALGMEVVEENKYPELYLTKEEAENAKDKLFRVIRGV